MSYQDWKTVVPPPFATQIAYEKCEGRPERIEEIQKYLPNQVPTQWPRRIQDFYDEMIALLIQNARSKRKPDLKVIQWLRGIIYQALSFCQTGPEIIDSCAAAIQRQHTLLEPHVFWLAMKSLTTAEPHTSYRTPLSLESAVLFLFETVRTNSTPLPPQAPIHKKDIPVQNELVAEPKPDGGVGASPAPVSSAAYVETAKATPAVKQPRVRRSKKADS
jgi:hypothetical protein